MSQRKKSTPSERKKRRLEFLKKHGVEIEEAIEADRRPSVRNSLAAFLEETPAVRLIFSSQIWSEFRRCWPVYFLGVAAKEDNEEACLMLLELLLSKLNVDLPEGILRPSRLGGRRLKAQTQSAHAEWIEKGKPDPITAKICDEILRTVYPTECAKVRVGSKAHKRWRDPGPDSDLASRKAIRYETDFIAATKLDFVALLILSTFP